MPWQLLEVLCAAGCQDVCATRMYVTCVPAAVPSSMRGRTMAVGSLAGGLVSRHVWLSGSQAVLVPAIECTVVLVAVLLTCFPLHYWCLEQVR